MKYISPDGYSEVVFTASGAVETNETYEGTYNVADPHYGWGITHVIPDVIPYLLLGNSPEDFSMVGFRLGVTGDWIWEGLPPPPQPAPTPSGGGCECPWLLK